MAVVDLHLHTTASDGRLTPAQLVRLAASRGLRTIAITDHDSTEGLEEAFATARDFPYMTVIPGIEINTDAPAEEVHILGYFLRYHNDEFQDSLRYFRNGRKERGRRMVEKLNKLGIHIEWERVKELAAGGAIGRPHVAIALVEKGYVKELKEAFDRYIGRNGPAYVERIKLAPQEAVRIIRGVGGVAVLAHPGDLRDLESVLTELKLAGLVGMEVFYARYRLEKIKELADVAKRYSLLPCGGSDFHGLGNSNEPLPGELGPPEEVVEALRRHTLQIQKGGGGG